MTFHTLFRHHRASPCVILLSLGFFLFIVLLGLWFVQAQGLIELPIPWFSEPSPPPVTPSEQPKGQQVAIEDVPPAVVATAQKAVATTVFWSHTVAYKVPPDEHNGKATYLLEAPMPFKEYVEVSVNEDGKLIRVSYHR